MSHAHWLGPLKSCLSFVRRRHPYKPCKRRQEQCLLNLEALEDRRLLTNFVVVFTTDGGAGSLRDAIGQVNNDTSDSSSNPDRITFNIAGDPSQVQTIRPGSPLPIIARPVIIDGYS